ncbi:OB-fold nucleic acid binding domain-containing protein [Methanocaldococcus infernus]
MNYEYVKKILSKKLNLTEDEIEERVKKLINEYGGIITKEAAILMLAKEEGIDIEEEPEEEFKIKDLEDGMIVSIKGKVYDVRESSTESQRVINLVIGDETGYVPVTLWNINIELEEGDVIELKKVRVKRKKKLSLVSTDETEVIKLGKEEVETKKIKDLNIGDFAIIEGSVFSSLPIKRFEKGKFRSFILSDGEDSIRVVLWHDLADTEIRVGDLVRVKGWIVPNYYNPNQLECSTTNIEILERADGEIEVVPIEDLKYRDEGERVSIRGKVLAKSLKRTVELEKPIKVQDLIVEDETGRVKITFWGMGCSHLDNVSEGDIVLIKNCKVKKYVGMDGEEVISLNAGIDSEVIIEKKGEVKFNKIKEILEENLDIANVFGVVTDVKDNIVEVDGVKKRVKNVIIDDGTPIRLTLWEEAANIELEEGDIIKVYNASVKKNELVLTRYGRIEKVKFYNKKFIIELIEDELSEVRGTIVKKEEDEIELCPICRRRVINGECPNCGIVEAEKVKLLRVMLDDGTGVLECRAYGKRAEKLNRELGDEIVIYGILKNKIFNVKAIKRFDINREIEYLKKVLEEER